MDTIKENIKVEIITSNSREYHHRIDIVDKAVVEKEIGSISGVVRVIVQKYSIWVKKGVMFDWKEIEPKIIYYIGGNQC